jgi:hypothetical protein
VGQKSTVEQIDKAIERLEGRNRVIQDALYEMSDEVARLVEAMGRFRWDKDENECEIAEWKRKREIAEQMEAEK